MKKLNLSLLLSFAIFVDIIHQHQCLSNIKFHVPTLVSKINSLENNPWESDTYGFEDMHINELKTRLGMRDSFNKNRPIHSWNKSYSKDEGKNDSQSNNNLPSYFNWSNTTRTNCPVGNIRNQAQCGSCWAVSTASAFSDRVCIKSNGSIRISLSSNYITACDKNNYGCKGGYMHRVADFVKNVGVVTGGEYESDEGCQPYTVRPCGYPHLFPCVRTYTPKCKSTTCSNQWYGSEKETTIYKAKSWSNVRHEDEIMENIYNHGPLTTGFMVYSDFPFYKKGIYVVTEGSEVIGGHAVKVIGWGIEKNIKYWIVQNSWSKWWGEHGYFRIRRGINMCDFEDLFISLIPDL